jgi:multicomponent Na+:H+ antiporter subunit E
MMYVVVLLAALTAVYAMTLASFAWQDLVTGLALASVLLYAFRRFVLPPELPRVRLVLRGIIFFPKLVAIVIYEVLKGTWLVVSITSGLRPLSHPGIIKVPLRDHSESGVAIVSFLITLSPGSFVISHDWDERFMLVHYIDISDPDQLRADADRYFRLWEQDVAEGTLRPATGDSHYDA